MSSVNEESPNYPDVPGRICEAAGCNWGPGIEGQEGRVWQAGFVDGGPMWNRLKYSSDSQGLTPLGQVSGSCPREPTWVTQLKLNILTLQVPGGLCFSQEDFGIVRIKTEIPSEPLESLQRQAGATKVLFSDCGCWLVCPQRASVGSGEERDPGMPSVWGFTWRCLAVWPF